jgi:hypothetical protein
VGQVVPGETDGPLAEEGPVGVEVVAVREEDALTFLGDEVQVGVGEVEDEALARAPPAVAVRGAEGDVVEEEPAVVVASRVPLGAGRHVGEAKARLLLPGVDHPGHRAPEGARQRALLQLVDHAHLLLDHVQMSKS